jgi:hypothetical protein
MGGQLRFPPPHAGDGNLIYRVRKIEISNLQVSQFTNCPADRLALKSLNTQLPVQQRWIILPSVLGELHIAYS